MQSTDTIVAIITPQGMGPTAALRLSGPDAIAIADKIFSSSVKEKTLATQAPRTLHYGTIHATDGTDIDQVIVSIFRAPHSFTGEDVVEISCHGSVVIQRRMLQLLIEAGARMATAGEFSKRAFVNGKMDLSQAEAVADLIAAESEAARRVALSQLKGGFSDKLKELREKLVHFSSLLELELDFSEEDVEFANRTELLTLIDNISEIITHLTNSFRLGNAIKKGIPTVIVGAPNVGKSTLLNMLVGDERAIVSDIQGTTRDAIEELINIGDLTFRLIDTAGIRKTDDKIETLGIERTFRHIDRAQIIILLLDATRPLADAEAQLKEVSQHINPSLQKLVIVINKIDVAPSTWADDAWRQTHNAAALIKISARNGQGMQALQDALTTIATNGQNINSEDIIVTNARHYEALTLALDALARVREGLGTNLSGEFVAIDLHEAIDALASITGEVSSQEVLNNIFAHFCIGK